MMYDHGLGVEKNFETSFKCFKSAAERGNVYAMGHLSLQYYKNKMFRNAFDVAKRLVNAIFELSCCCFFCKIWSHLTS